MSRLARLAARALGALMLLGAMHAVGAQSTREVPAVMLQAVARSSPGVPVAGAERGDVTVVEYFDYNCPVCRHLELQLRELVATDRKIRWIRKDWPIFGEGSTYAAYASFAASGEGRYEAAHEALISSPADLDTPDDVLTVLKKAGFDPQQIKADIAAHEVQYREALAKTKLEAQQLGLHGTPGLIVGSQLVLGGADATRLRKLIAAARHPT